MMKKVGKILRRIIVDKYVCAERVCRWHMTDEQMDSDQKDEQKHQVVFQESLTWRSAANDARPADTGGVFLFRHGGTLRLGASPSQSLLHDRKNLLHVAGHS